MPAQQSSTTADHTQSKVLSQREENMLEIQSLTEQVQQLAALYDRWSTISQVLVGITAFVTLLYFGATTNALRIGGKLKAAQDALSKAKDDQLTRDLKDKDEQIAGTYKEAIRIETDANRKIADAKAVASQANERAGKLEKENLEMRSGVANLEKEAAEANERTRGVELKLEEERIKRLELEKSIAPRRLRESETAFKRLRRFSETFFEIQIRRGPRSEVFGGRD
jgi:hypothetical protein